jgi:hypothetical protein
MINYVNDFPANQRRTAAADGAVGLREPQRHGAAQRQDDLVH